jgi:hypothetical protein
MQAGIMIAAAWPWVTLTLLGAWHGLNPGMGWLFCVALGLKQRSKRALFAALIPIALGHAIAIAMVVCSVYVLGAIVPFRWLQLGCAAALLGIALWKVYRLRHPKWVGMCVSFWDLTLWSWLMATAHGAGLMVVPVLLGARSILCGPTTNATNLFLLIQPIVAMGAVAVHTIAHLATTALIAWIVYDFIGLAILRRSWINLDLIWSFSLIGAAVFLFLLPNT